MQAAKDSESFGHILDRHIPEAGQEDFRGFDWYHLRYGHHWVRGRGWVSDSMLRPIETHCEIRNLEFNQATGDLLARYWDAKSESEMSCFWLVKPPTSFQGVGDQLVGKPTLGEPVVLPPCHWISSGPDRCFVTSARSSTNAKEDTRTLFAFKLEKSVKPVPVPFIPNHDWLLIDPSGRFLADYSSKKGLQVWDVQTQQQIGKISFSPSDNVAGISFSADGAKIFVMFLDGQLDIRIYDSKSANEIHRLPIMAHEPIVDMEPFPPKPRAREPEPSFPNSCKINVSPDGAWIAIEPSHGYRSLSGIVLVHSMTGVLRKGVTMYDKWLEPHESSGYVFKPFATYGPGAFSPDGQYYAAPGAEGIWIIQLSEPDTLRLIRHTVRASGRNLVFSPDSKILFSSQLEETIRLWDVETGMERMVLEGHTAPITCLALNQDGTLLASGDNRGTIRLWHAPRPVAAPGKEPQSANP
jgi:WD40 repeat protein